MRKDSVPEVSLANSLPALTKGIWTRLTKMVWRTKLPYLIPYEGDLIEKAVYYMDHEDEALAIGTREQQRTLKEHNTDRRADEFLDICQSYLRGVP
jgi:hypothetical protein